MSKGPTKLTPDQVLNLKSSMTGTVALRLGSPAEAGMTFPAPDGERFLYQTAASDVVYILVTPLPGNEHNRGQFFEQSRSHFASDIELGAVAVGVKRRTAASRKVMEGWVDLMMGAIGCASGPVGWAVTGFNIAIAGGKFMQNYDVYVKAIERILYHRQWFRTKTPTLYNVVLATMLFGKIQDKIQGSLVSAVSTQVAGKGVGGKLVGLFVGKLGEEYFKNTLKVINALFKEVLIKVAQHVYDNVGSKLSDDQVEALATHVQKQLKPILLISATDAKRIVRETAEGHIRSALLDLSAALDTL